MAMSWLIILVVLFALVALAGWICFLRVGDDFWRLAAGHADLAIALLALEPDCLVGAPPANDQIGNFVGPYRLTDATGETHSVYISRTHLKDVRTRVARKIRGASRSRELDVQAHAQISDPGARSRRRKRAF